MAETTTEANKAAIEDGDFSSIGAEIWGNKKEEPPKEVQPKEETPPKKPDPEPTETEDEKAAREAEEARAKEEAENQRILEADESSLTEEDKTKRTELVKQREEAATAEFEKEVAEYAAEHKLETDLVRKEFEASNGVLEKYNKDPKLIARAYVNSQKELAKMQAHIKDIEAKQSRIEPVKSITVEDIATTIENNEFIVPNQQTGKQMVITKDMVIERYRDANADIVADLDDDKVFKMAVKEFKAEVDKASIAKKADISVKAREKRLASYDSLKETDREFLSVVKPLVDKLSDEQIMSDGFDVNTFVVYAKGMNYEDRIKKLISEKEEHGKKEYERGLQQAKILGVKATPSGSAPSSDTSVSLNDEEKRRAVAMYGDLPGVTKEKAYEMYQDFKEYRVSKKRS